MRVTRTIKTTPAEIESAKESAIALIGKTEISTVDLFKLNNLEKLEEGLRNLNNFAIKARLLSSLLLYTIVFNEEVYKQSGLDWIHYSRQSRERLGLDQREITDQLSLARFFIRNHKELQEEGFTLEGNLNKLARAELAEKLSGSTKKTINHLISDSWVDFKEWYTSFKPKKDTDSIKGFHIAGKKFLVGSIEAVKVSDKIPATDRTKLQRCIKAIFQIIADGKEPEIKAK